HHLAPEREDLVGIAENHPTHLGERELATDLREQLLAELVLERVNLRAQGRMGEAEHLAGLGEPSLASDDPEVEQVVVVHPFHGLGNMSLFSTCVVDFSSWSTFEPGLMKLERRGWAESRQASAVRSSP